jgi:hypothetical protein
MKTKLPEPPATSLPEQKRPKLTRALIQRQCAQKFTPFPSKLGEAIGILATPQLEELSLKLLVFDRIEIFNQWLIEALGRQLTETLSPDRQLALPSLSLDELIALAQDN